MPRALFFLSDFGGGGAQRTLINLAASMPSDMLDVELAVANANGPACKWVPQGLTYHDLGCRRMNGAIPAFVGLIRSRAPDAVLSTMTHANVATWVAARLAGGNAAVALRETNSLRARSDLGPTIRRLAAFTYRRADLVVGLSEGVRREMVRDMRLAPERTRTIPNPVDVSSIAKRVASARKSPSPWPAGRRRPRILGIGRLVRQKAFEILIDAANSQVPEADIVLLGEGPDRASLANRHQGSGRLVMPGFVEDTTPYMAHADIFVLSSRWEGFGHVIVEAMAAGLPVVATDCPYGPADIITHGKTGLLVPNEEACALGNAIARMFDEPALRGHLAAAGRRAAARFESASVAAHYTAALLDAISRRASQG